MECRAVPYEGTETRAVMIHAGEDDAVVFPFMERLCRSGMRIWHDAEIRKVMVEYSRNWKKQQAECGAFLVFLSETAAGNHVFRERFTNAIESGKPVVLILSVKEDELSPGMRLQAAKAARAIQSSYIPKEKLTEEVFGLETLKACAGAPNPGMEISAYPSEEAKPVYTAPVRTEREIAPSERTMLELHRPQSMSAFVPAAVSGENAPTDTQEKIPETPAEPDTSNASLEKTTDTSVRTDNIEASLEATAALSAGADNSETDLDKTVCLTPEESLLTGADPEATLIPKRTELPVILSLSSGEKKKGILGEAVVGRTKKIQGAMADISFTDDCRLFSGKHFHIFYIDNMCILICKHPNGMNVNGQEMQEGDKFTVDSEALIQIPSNATLAQFGKGEVQPSYLIVAAGKRANELWDTEALAYLKSEETGEIRYFTDQFPFGRGNAWKTGVMSSRNISRNHGGIALEEGKFMYQDHSTNGTRINDRKINNETVELKNKDIISVQGDGQNEESFVFRCCFFERG